MKRRRKKKIKSWEKKKFFLFQMIVCLPPASPRIFRHFSHHSPSLSLSLSPTFNNPNTVVLSLAHKSLHTSYSHSLSISQPKTLSIQVLSLTYSLSLSLCHWRHTLRQSVKPIDLKEIVVTQKNLNDAMCSKQASRSHKIPSSLSKIKLEKRFLLKMKKMI